MLLEESFKQGKWGREERRKVEVRQGEESFND